MKRKIVEFDESKCDGCGDCIPSCAESAIQLVDGKARLAGDRLCDGLGACLGACEKGAIRVPFAYARFHDDLLAGRRVVVGCPKLDDSQAYAGKLAEILRLSDVRSVTVAKLEVPCCGGIAWAARQALAQAGKAIPYREITVGVRGELLP